MSPLPPNRVPTGSRRVASLMAAAVVGALVAAGPAAAQGPNEAEIRKFFEGTRVQLRIDMPGSSDGVDVMVDRTFDQKKYSDRMQRFGSAIRGGDVATVTLVKVKKDLIEFQLDGGGYGTFGDDTGSVYMPDVPKSNREDDLEKAIKKETDAKRKREMQRELDDLRNARLRENRRIAFERQIAEERKREQIAARRAQGGSRFNIRFPANVPTNVSPRDVVAALEEFIDFSPQPTTGLATARPGDNMPMGEGMPRKGMLRLDAERQFGRPITTAERREGILRVVTLVFQRGDQRITAEFVEDVMIRYTVSSR